MGVTLIPLYVYKKTASATGIIIIHNHELELYRLTVIWTQMEEGGLSSSGDKMGVRIFSVNTMNMSQDLVTLTGNSGWI